MPASPAPASGATKDSDELLVALLATALVAASVDMVEVSAVAGPAPVVSSPLVEVAAGRPLEDCSPGAVSATLVVALVWGGLLLTASSVVAWVTPCSLVTPSVTLGSPPLLTWVERSGSVTLTSVEPR